MYASNHFFHYHFLNSQGSRQKCTCPIVKLYCWELFRQGICSHHSYSWIARVLSLPVFLVHLCTCCYGYDDVSVFYLRPDLSQYFSHILWLHCKEDNITMPHNLQGNMCQSIFDLHWLVDPSQLGRTGQSRALLPCHHCLCTNSNV